MNSIEKRKLRQKRYYERNKEKIKKKKLEYYYNNKKEMMLKQKEYRERFIKPFTGSKGSGNYNITLAERNKKEWLKHKLYFYKLKLNDKNEEFYKYGLTKNIKNRLRHIPYNIEVLEIKELNKYDAIKKEHELLKSINRYIPKIKFGGYSECFTIL